MTEIFRSDLRLPAGIDSICLRGTRLGRDGAELPEALAQDMGGAQENGMTIIPAAAQLRRERFVTPVRPVCRPVARCVSDRSLVARLCDAAQACLEHAFAYAGEGEVGGMPIGRRALLRIRLPGQSGAPSLHKPLAAVERAEAAQRVA